MIKLNAHLPIPCWWTLFIFLYLCLTGKSSGLHKITSAVQAFFSQSECMWQILTLLFICTAVGSHTACCNHLVVVILEIQATFSFNRRVNLVNFACTAVWTAHIMHSIFPVRLSFLKGHLCVCIYQTHINIACKIADIVSSSSPNQQTSTVVHHLLSISRQALS